MKKREENKFKSLFNQYDLLDEEQTDLYDGEIELPIENKEKYNELQIKKIAILDELAKTLK